MSVSMLHLHACNDFSAAGKVKECLSDWGYLQLNSSCPWEAGRDGMQNGKKCPGELQKKSIWDFVLLLRN